MLTDLNSITQVSSKPNSLALHTGPLLATSSSLQVAISKPAPLTACSRALARHTSSRLTSMVKALFQVLNARASSTRSSTHRCPSCSNLTSSQAYAETRAAATAALAMATKTALTVARSGATLFSQPTLMRRSTTRMSWRSDKLPR